MKQLSLFTIAFLLLLGNTFAQKDETLFKRFDFRLTGAWGGSMFGMTALDGDILPQTGGFGGIEINKEFFIGWGGAGVSFPALVREIHRDFDYNGLILSYTPYAYRAIHPKANLLIGKGNIYATETHDYDLLVLQASVGGEANLLQWCRAGLDLGYRFTRGSGLSGLTDRQLSGAYAALSFKFGFSWGRSSKYKRDEIDEEE